MKLQAQLFLSLMVGFAGTQFTARYLSKTPCESRGTTLVEQFFNVIFTEFQHSPPTCTCVQMCPEQPTYCYPNGCFKKTERKQDTSPVSSIQQEAKTVFLVDNNKDTVADLMESTNNRATSTTDNAERRKLRPWETNLLNIASPYKEIVYKYKRLPKLQMKYNLREQVKHTRDKKAEVDLSKTRWPTNKQINRQMNHQKSSNYLTSVFPEVNRQENPRYFKRYLTKRENQVGLDISALYLYNDASNFSLESLIDNLIERGLEDTNNTSELKIEKSNKLKDEENNSDTKLMNSVAKELKNDTKLMNSITKELKNDTKEIVMKLTLISNATDSSDKRYEDNCNNTNSSTATYFEMITTISKQIEKQNNVSVEVMSHLTGNSYNDILNATSAEPYNGTNKDINFKTALNLSDVIKSTTSTVSTTISYIPVINRPVKKSKQRIVRKLRNRKFN